MNCRNDPEPRLSATLLRSFIVASFGVFLLFHPLLGQEANSTLWGDNYDARLLHWIAEWGYQALTVQGSFAEFWNAPSFYPHLKSLAFSDSLLSAQLFYSPLRLLGVAPFSALYMTLALACVSACLLSGVALRRLGFFEPLECALIVFVAHFGLGISGYLPHYQLFGFQFAFPYFLFLYLTLRDWRGFDFAAAALCACIGIGFATYLGPMLAVTTVVLVLPTLTRLLRRKELTLSLRRLGGSAWGVVIVSVLALYVLQIRPYLDVSDRIPKQSFDESAVYSATPTSLLKPALGGNSLWYGPPPGLAKFGDAERAFFLGVVVTYPCVAFLLLWAARRLSGYGSLDEAAPGIEPGFLWYLFLLLVTVLILSLGPYPLAASWLKLPFWYASAVIPGLERVRAPGRFGIFAALPAICFALAMLRTVCASGRARTVALAAACVLVPLDSVPAYRTFPFESDPKGVYTRLEKVLGGRKDVIIELPLAGGDFLRTLLRVTEQLHGTLTHGGRIFVGYGAAETAEAKELGLLDLKLQRKKAKIVDIMEFAARHDARLFVVHLDRYPPKIRKRWQRFLSEHPSLKIHYQDERTLMFEAVAQH